METFTVTLQSLMVAMLWLGLAGSCIAFVLIVLQKITTYGDPKHSRKAITRRVAIRRMLREVEHRNRGLSDNMDHNL